jgi:hypothetical protein
MAMQVATVLMVNTVVMVLLMEKDTEMSITKDMMNIMTMMSTIMKEVSMKDTMMKMDMVAQFLTLLSRDYK